MLRIFLYSLISLITIPLLAQEHWEKIDQTDGLISNKVVDFIEENPNKWWVATDFGISLIENGQISNYPLISSNPITINDLELAQGKVWMATDNGLYSFDGASFQHFDTTNGFTTLDIAAIAVDSKDDLWIGTLDAVSMYDGQIFTRHDSIGARFLFVDANDKVHAYLFKAIINFPNFNSVFDNNRWVDYGSMVGQTISGDGFIEANGSIFLYGSRDSNSVKGIYKIDYPGTPVFQALEMQSMFGISYNHIIKDDSLIITSNSANIFLTTDSALRYVPLRNGAYININTLAQSDQKIFICSDEGLIYSDKRNRRTLVIDSLDVNNVKSKVFEFGPPFSSTLGYVAGGFGFPKNNPTYSIYTGDFVFVGRNSQTSAFQNTLNPFIYEWDAGPVNTEFALGKSYMVKIRRQEVLNHIANFNQIGYQMPASIKNWPALGDSLLGIAPDLAPFVDVNQNGCYDPQNGDYPAIKGDEAIYWIKNHPDRSLRLEYHYMLYAYNSSQNPELNQAQFLQCRIVNRGTDTYDSAKVGFFFDGDLGFPGDDYIGSDSSENIAYFYNGDDFDEGFQGQPGFGANSPAVGVKFLSDSMTNMVAYNTVGGQNGEPFTPFHWWQYMNSRFLNGTPVTYDYFGYNSSAAVSHLFSGDPYNLIGWTERTPGGPGSTPNDPGDRRLLASVENFTFAPGESKIIEVVMAYGQKSSTLSHFENVPELKRVLNELEMYWDTLSTQNVSYGSNYSCPGAIGLEEQSTENNQLKIYPNPANDQLFIESDLSMRQIQIYSLSGALIRDFQINHKRLNFSLNDIDRGLYLIRISDEKGHWYNHKLIVE